MVDYNRSGNLRGCDSIWRGYSESLAINKGWSAPMMWRISAMVLFGTTSGFMGLWLADREPPTYVARIENLAPKVVAGGEFRIRYTVQRKRSCYVRVERMLLDGQLARFVMPPTEFQGVPVGDDMYVSVVKVPEEASAGKGGYQTITTYKCNPIHSLWPIIVVGPRIDFEIM